MGLLYDPGDDYLALTPNLSLVRYLRAPTPVRPLQIDGPLRVLLMAGSSAGLDLADEIGSIQRITKPLVESQRLVVDVLERTSLDSLYEKFSRGRYHIVHYLGHGEAPDADTPAQLLLYDDRGEPAAVDITQVWRTLRRSETLRLIWLNSCEGAVGQPGALIGPLASAAARFVAAGVPAVLANQLRISDDAARKLAHTFYSQLSDGAPVDVALAEARVKVSVSAQFPIEWATPVLYMRAADGILFSPPASSEQTTPQTPNLPVDNQVVQGLKAQLYRTR